MILKCGKCNRSHQLRPPLKKHDGTKCLGCGTVGSYTEMFFHGNLRRGVNLYRTKRSRREPVNLWALPGDIGHTFVVHHADAIGTQGTLL